MSDITTIGTAALSAIADGDIHWAAELVVAVDALLEHNGVSVVALALIAALYRVAMRVVERWQIPRRRGSDRGAGGTPPLPPPAASDGGGRFVAPPAVVYLPPPPAPPAPAPVKAAPATSAGKPPGG